VHIVSTPEICFVAARSAATKQTVLNALAKRYKYGSDHGLSKIQFWWSSAAFRTVRRYDGVFILKTSLFPAMGREWSEWEH
jgi:hypothetical protein